MGHASPWVRPHRKKAEIDPAGLSRFTYGEYQEILLALSAKGYKFIGYHEAAERPFVMIRHDLDFSLERALPFAKIEQTLGVRTTYCLMLRTNSYNVFSRANSTRVLEIMNRGHYLGLHFDSGAYRERMDEAETAVWVQAEVKVIEKWFGADVKLVSFHKPNALALGGSPKLTEPTPHAYQARFMDSMVYLSDSYGFWRYGHPLEHEAFVERQSLNLAVHPIWWNEKRQSPIYSMNQAMAEKKAELREYMLTDLVGV